MARSVEIAERWDAPVPARTAWVWASPPRQTVAYPQRPYRADAEWSDALVPAPGDGGGH